MLSYDSVHSDTSIELKSRLFENAESAVIYTIQFTVPEERKRYHDLPKPIYKPEM